MTNEDLKTLAAIATPSLVILGRLWSMVEHKKTGKEIQEIRISLNGDLDRRIQGIVHNELNNTDMPKNKSKHQNLKTMEAVTIYKVLTGEFVQSINPLVLTDNIANAYDFLNEEDAETEAGILSDSEETQFKVGRPDDRHPA